MKAIESLVEYKATGRRILVMGDMLELGKSSLELHRQIGRFISQKPLDMLVTLGKLSRATADTLKSRSRKQRSIFTFDSKSELTNFLKNSIKSGDILLIKGSRLLRMEDITNSLIKME
jgi:UDP-N-acetylmuramoyl-tripeptide--D-alanyl-D-alanine ligase